MTRLREVEQFVKLITPIVCDGCHRAIRRRGDIKGYRKYVFSHGNEFRPLCGQCAKEEAP